VADVQEILTRKAGPLPVWGWAAVAGGALSILYLRGKGQTGASSSDQQPNAPGTAPFAAPIIYSPVPADASTPAASTPGTPAAPTTPAPKNGITTGDATGIFVSPTTKSSVIAVLKQNTPVTVTGPPVPGETWGGISYWVPVDYGGQPGYIAGALIQLATGMGGGHALQTTDGAGEVLRFASPLAQPQYVRTGMGGRGALHAVSRRTGIPMIRLMALNPGQLRGGRPPVHIHIR